MPENIYHVAAIGENSWKISEDMVRSYLFAGTHSALLVDTGKNADGNLKAIVEGLTKLPLTVINTHADNDHTAGNFRFDNIRMHPSEFIHYYENSPDAAAVTPVWEGDIIDLGGRQFEVILIPGHTPGSIALLNRAERILVSGDSISAGPIFMFGKMRNLRAYIASMEKLLTFTDSFDTIYAAHDPEPLRASQIEKEINAAKRLLAGELEGKEPLFPVEAKMYMSDGAGFYY